MRYDVVSWVLLASLASCTGGDGSDTDTDAVLDAIHVAPDGDDDWPGTPTLPMASPKEAVKVALENALDVRIAGGTYDDFEAVVTGVSMEGGYDPDTWEHVPGEQTTVLTSAGTTLSVEPEEGVSVTVAHLGVGDALDGRVNVYSSDDGVVALEDLSVGQVYLYSGAASFERVTAQGRVHLLSGSAEVVDSALYGGLDIHGGESTLLDSNVGELSFICPAEITPAVGCSMTATGITASGLSLSGNEAVVGAFDVRDSVIYSPTPLFFFRSNAVFAGNTVTVAIPPAAGNTRGLVVGVGATVTLVGNTFRSSKPGGDLTGILVSEAEALLGHNVFVIEDAAAATVLEASGDVVAVNNAFVVPETAGDEVGIRPGAQTPDLTLLHNSFTGVSCLVSGACPDLDGLHACAWTGCTEASGNLEVPDPGFADPDDGDFHIASGGPLHDAGTDPLVEGFVLDDVSPDADGDTRPQGGGWDIGVDEVAE